MRTALAHDYLIIDENAAGQGVSPEEVLDVLFTENCRIYAHFRLDFVALGRLVRHSEPVAGLDC